MLVMRLPIREASLSGKLREGPRLSLSVTTGARGAAPLPAAQRPQASEP